MGPKTWRSLFLRWLFAFAILVAILFILSVIARDWHAAHYIPGAFHAMLFGGYRIH